jgi:hypothetical protein
MNRSLLTTDAYNVGDIVVVIANTDKNMQADKHINNHIGKRFKVVTNENPFYELVYCSNGKMSNYAWYDQDLMLAEVYETQVGKELCKSVTL